MLAAFPHFQAPPGHMPGHMQAAGLAAPHQSEHQLSFGASFQLAITLRRGGDNPTSTTSHWGCIAPALEPRPALLSTAMLAVPAALS